MKKQFTTLFLLAATMLVPPALTGCGEGIEVSESIIDEGGENPTGEKVTVFSSEAPEGTRTEIDANGEFYWTDQYDNIWLELSSSNRVSLKATSISSNQKTATYKYTSTSYLTGSYTVYYTGYNSSSYNTVTIASSQSQSSENDGSQIGRYGDCGVATATRVSEGKYSFKLDHKAAYLIIYPYKKSDIEADWKLTRIEVISNNTIAGTYSFSSSGLSSSPSSGASSTITLTCGSGISLGSSASQKYYVVIAPGTHTLSLRFHVSTPGGQTFYVTKDLPSYDYAANYVVPIQHEIDVLRFRRQSYKWDATIGNYYGSGGYDGPSTIASNEVTSGTTIPTQASRSAYTMPNANAMYWFVKDGDPRWDNVTPWTLNVAPLGYNVYRAGAWVKRASYISTYDVEKTDLVHRANASITNLDLRKRGPWNAAGLSNQISDGSGAIRVYSNTSSSYRTGGKPSDTSQYFYLPAMGGYANLSGNVVNEGLIGYYWSKSPFPVPSGHNATQFAYYFAITPERCTLNVAGDRNWGCTVNTSAGIRYFP